MRTELPWSCSGRDLEPPVAGHGEPLLDAERALDAWRSSGV